MFNFVSKIVNTVYSVATGRSPHWEEVRKAHLEKESFCQACGTTENLQVHHLRPFHLDPARELDDTNLITLCLTDHLLFGHLRDWKAVNPKVREDAADWLQKIKGRKYTLD